MTRNRATTRATTNGELRRAHYSVKHGAQWKADLAAAAKMRGRRARAAKHPSTPAELAKAIADYTGPITKCPPGWHAGHLPRTVSNPD